MYSVFVEFILHGEHLEEFLLKVQANASTSLTQEPGCIQFDVCLDDDQPNIVWLYEVYNSRTDFEAHLASPHFKAFSSATSDAVLNKRIRGGELFRPSKTE